jgi:hypothetical protein
MLFCFSNLAGAHALTIATIADDTMLMMATQFADNKADNTELVMATQSIAMRLPTTAATSPLWSLLALGPECCHLSLALPTTSIIAGLLPARH